MHSVACGLHVSVYKDTRCSQCINTGWNDARRLITEKKRQVMMYAVTLLLTAGLWACVSSDPVVLSTNGTYQMSLAETNSEFGNITSKYHRNVHLL